MASLRLPIDDSCDVGGSGEQDVLNRDTFGDCDVGDDWKPTAEQEAFAREHELQRSAADPQGPLGTKPPPGLSLAGHAAAAPPSQPPLDSPYKIPLPSGLAASSSSVPGIPGPALVTGYPLWPPPPGISGLPAGPGGPPSPLSSPFGAQAGLAGPSSPSMMAGMPLGVPGALPGMTSPHPALLGALGLERAAQTLRPPGAGLFGVPSPFDCPDLSRAFPPGLPSAVPPPHGPASLLGGYLAPTAPAPLGTAQASPPRTPTTQAPGALPLLSALEGVLPPAFSSAGPRPPRMLSVAELEAQMLQAAPSRPASELTPQPQPQPQQSRRLLLGGGAPPPADGAPGAQAAARPSGPASAGGTEAAPAASEVEEVAATTPAPIAPFTEAHRALLRTDANSSSVRPFLRELEQSRSHPSFMTSSDKELIVRIQLSQMAAVGGQCPVQNYRGAFINRGRKAKDMSENIRPVENSALVMQLKESISQAHCEASAEGAAPAERTAAIAPSAEGSVKTAAAEEALPTGEAVAPPEGLSAGAPEEPAEGHEEPSGTLRDSAAASAEAGARSDRKFGPPLYASVHHPRRSIAIQRGEAGASTDAPLGSQHPPAQACPSDSHDAAEGLRTSSYWRSQLVIEQAFEELMDLELLTHRLLECHPLDVEKQDRLTSERSKVLDRVCERVLAEPKAAAEDGPAGAAGEAGRRAAARPPEHSRAALGAMLGLRKGRSLLQRLLLGLLPPVAMLCERGRGELVLSAVLLLWRLVASLLELAPEQLWGTDPSQDAKEGWQKLRLALLHSVEAARSHADAGHPRRCAEALAALLHGHGGGRFEATCLSKSGVALIRQLVQGCAGGQAEDAAEIEFALDKLIEGVCAALPRLYDAAQRSKAASSPVGDWAVASTVHDDLTQEDLWAMLIAITERASGRQKRRIRGLIGAFVSGVSTSGE